MSTYGYAPVQTSGYAPVQTSGYAPVQTSGYSPDPQYGYAQDPQTGYPVEGYAQEPQQNNTRAIKPSTIAIGFLCLLLIWFFFFKKDATYGEWSDWSSCSKPCGTNATKERTRKYIPAQYGGTDIPEASRKLTETQECTDLPLCNDGSYSEWRTKTPCTTRYSDDFLEEERSYIPADYGGVDIPVASRVLTRKSPCGTQPRPVNDYFTDYIDVAGSVCRKEQNKTSPAIVCGTGWKEQVRTYVPAQPGGVNTLNSSDTTRWVPCTAPKPVCQTRNGSCTDWQFSGSCSNDYALFTRTYNPPVDGGDDNSCRHELSSNRLNNISYHCGKLEDPVNSGCMGAHNQQKKTITQIYTLPSLYNNSPIKPYDSTISSMFDSGTINRMQNLGLNQSFTISKYTIKKIQRVPDVVEITYTEDCPLIKLSNSSIENVWKNTIGCTEPLGTTFTDNFNSNNYHFIDQNQNVFDSRNLIFDTEGNVRSKLSKYNLDYILEKQNTSTNFDNMLNMIDRCNKSQVLTETDATRLSSKFTQKNRLYPGLCYKRITLINGNYKLEIGGSNNLALYHSNNAQPYWTDSFSKSIDNNVCMQNDGNFVIYRANKTQGGNNAIWASGTSGNSGAYLELTNHGFIIIKNKGGNVIWRLNITEVAQKHFEKLRFYQLLKGGDEYMLPDRARVYSCIAYSNNFTWSRDQFNLLIQNDGNLVMYKNNQTSGSNNAVWSTGTNGNNNSVLIMQNDGNLVLYPRNDTNSQALTSSITSGNNGATAYIEIENQYRGHLIIWNKDNNKRIGTMARITTERLDNYRSLHPANYYIHLVGGDEFMLNSRSHIYPYMRYSNQFTFRSPNGQFRLIMQNDGNLVLYNDVNNSGVWSSRTDHNDMAILTSQFNGNLAIDKKSGGEVWDIDRKKYKDINSNTIHWGEIRNDGNFIYYRADGTWIWDSNWHNRNR